MIETDLRKYAGSESQIGHVIRSFNTQNQDGNDLLPLNGAVLDDTKYPVLAEVLGKREQLTGITKVATTDCQHMVQSDDGEYCYVVKDTQVYRYKKSDNSYTLILTGDYDKGSDISCSADGRYVVFVTGESSGTLKCNIYSSRDYGATFTVFESPLSTSGFSAGKTFVSRSGLNMLAVVSNSQGPRFLSSTDAGINWTLNADKPDGIPPITDAFACHENFERILITTNNVVWYSDDIGVNWTEVSQRPDIDIISIDPYSDNAVGVRDNKLNLQISDANGTSWQSIPIPDDILYIQDVKYDNNAIIITATQAGSNWAMYVTLDQGGTWIPNAVFEHTYLFKYNPKRRLGSDIYFFHNPAQALYRGRYDLTAKLPKSDIESEKIIADKVTS